MSMAAAKIPKTRPTISPVLLPFLSGGESTEIKLELIFKALNIKLVQIVFFDEKVLEIICNKPVDTVVDGVGEVDGVGGTLWGTSVVRGGISVGIGQP